MDGEIDMDNMEEQLKEIEANMEGLGAKKSDELTEAEDIYIYGPVAGFNSAGVPNMVWV